MRSNGAALVTGGSGGIGTAICHALAADGLNVIVADLDRDKAQAVADGLDGDGHIGLGIDVGDEASVAATFASGEQVAGVATILVTCAGIHVLNADGERASIADMSVDIWDETQAVNARGTFLCCREYARRLEHPASHARVVMISSVSARIGGIRASAAYTASKSAVLGLTKAFARELAPAGVTVNAVLPGLIDTPMLNVMSNTGPASSPAAAVPLGRLGTPDDVASVVRFLVSPQASYITGASIDVNGGLFMS